MNYDETSSKLIRKYTDGLDRRMFWQFNTEIEPKLNEVTRVRRLIVDALTEETWQ